MAKFQLNPGSQGKAHLYQPERVRIGSISLFALVVVICLAVLSVLAFSTANASLTMSQRQATATTELYLDETAAQEFLAGVDAILASERAVSGNINALAEEEESQIELGTNEWGNVAYDENGLVVVVEKDENPAAGTARAAGDAGNAGASAGSSSTTVGKTASKSVEAALSSICAAAEQVSDNRVTATAQMFDNRIKAEFSCQNGRVLNIVVTIRNNGTFRIDRWKMSAVQNEEPPEGQFMIIDD